MTSTGKRRRRATIQDVATEAGVSMATVSRALRGLPNVAASTRERVRTVAASLNYRPDPAASQLAAGRTGTVMVAVPTLSGWFFSAVVAGAESVCAAAGYRVSVVGLPDAEDRVRLLSDETDIERRADGVLLVEIPITADRHASLSDRGIAVATTGAATTARPTVRIDDEAVGHLAARHLVELGHRRLALIGGLEYEPTSFDVTSARRRGFERGLAEDGLELDEELIEGGDFTIDGGLAATAVLLDHPHPPTGIFAMSDEMAFGTLMELRRRGVRAGRDVSIIGVDDHEFSRVVELSTVRQPVARHGELAAHDLLAAMADPTADRLHVDAPVELVTRATTAPVSR